jgi:hypothetical protein
MVASHDINGIPLTSSEVTFLWSTYMLESKCKQIYTHAAKCCADKDILDFLQTALLLSSSHIGDISAIFNTVNHPIPEGFTDKDINIDAQKLFSDKIMLRTLKGFTGFSIGNYGMALGSSARSDVRGLFKSSLLSAIELLDKIDTVSIEKGLFERTPVIPVPKEVEFAEKESIMGRIIGHSRPMNVAEISEVYNAGAMLATCEAQFLGLSQAVKDDSIKAYILRANDLCREQYKRIKGILGEENLPTPSVLSNEVLNSSEPPYSDKLSIFFTIAEIRTLLSMYSAARLLLIRKDIHLNFVELEGEVLLLAKEGMDVMTSKGWYEEIPKNVERKDLVLH